MDPGRNIVRAAKKRMRANLGPWLAVAGALGATVSQCGIDTFNNTLGYVSTKKLKVLENTSSIPLLREHQRVWLWLFFCFTPTPHRTDCHTHRRFVLRRRTGPPVPCCRCVPSSSHSLLFFGGAKY